MSSTNFTNPETSKLRLIKILKWGFFSTPVLLACLLGAVLSRQSDTPISARGDSSDTIANVTEDENAAHSQAALSESLPGGLTMQELDTLRGIQLRFTAGDYGATLQLIDNALAVSEVAGEYAKWLRDQLPVVLVSQGWFLIGVADCEGAIEHFRRAEAIQQTLEGTKGLAYCHHRLAQVHNAHDYIARYLEEKPTDFPMQLIYSDVLESQSRYDEASVALERALAAYDEGEDADIQRQELITRLESMRARSREAPQQIVTHSQFLEIKHRANEEAVFIQLVIDTLEQAIDWLNVEYGFTYPKHRIEVVLYPTEQFADLGGHGLGWAEGIFDGRIRVPVAGGDKSTLQIERLRQVLRHELVHALLAQIVAGRDLPTWFNEGLAQRMECAPDPCGVLQLPAVPGPFLVEERFSHRFTSFSAVEARVAYIQSLYLILTLEQGFGFDEPVRQVISQLGRQGSLRSDSILAPLSLSFAELHTAAKKRWQSGWSYRY